MLMKLPDNFRIVAQNFVNPWESKMQKHSLFLTVSDYTPTSPPLDFFESVFHFLFHSGLVFAKPEDVAGWPQSWFRCAASIASSYG